jgi:transcriptional regulator with PAS, ATPase and Fis domain
MDGHQLIGVSNATRMLRAELESAGRSEAKVLIAGESGVGKEIAAHMIHQFSRRRSAPMVTINCAGMPDGLLESELFGHDRGSFTGAHKDTRGWLERAHGGTIFMDELGEMSLRMQALLLRFLETGEIQRLGSERLKTVVDVRVVTATNRNLLERVEEKAFREDLYYRLNVINILIPPLRDRPEDIPHLLAHFLKVYTQLHRTAPIDLAPEARERLTSYAWPGNVRELKNTIERLVVAGKGPLVQPEDLSAEIQRRPAAAVWPARQETVSAPESTRVEMIYSRIKSGEDFWVAVHRPFMARDLTREEVRAIVRCGLSEALGNYRLLVAIFNMPPSDYRRFLSFLRKYACHLPFEAFRTTTVRPSPASEPPALANASRFPLEDSAHLRRVDKLH